MDRAYERVAEELLDDIVAGRIGAREWLPRVADIAERHACSAGAAREAIRALEERGVVVVHAGKGQEVREREEWDLVDGVVAEAVLFRHRDQRLLGQAVEYFRLMETQAAMLAAPRAEDGDLEFLEQTVDQMRDGRPAQETDYHRALIAMSGNRFFVSALDSVHPQIARVRRARAPDRDGAVIRLHDGITAALTARDPTAAAAAVDSYGGHLASWLRV
jgi:GntR family transcriptional repressor for pyruvate dehydrogenase complex